MEIVGPSGRLSSGRPKDELARMVAVRHRPEAAAEEAIFFDDVDVYLTSLTRKKPAAEPTDMRRRDSFKRTGSVRV